MVDFSLQRMNLVESQVRPSDITDRRIVGAMLEVPREMFLPEALRTVAYSDAILSLAPIAGVGPGRQMLTAATVAHLIQPLQLGEDHVVLLVGAGTGYEAAVLARIAQTVVAVESDAALVAYSEAALTAQDIANAAVVRGALNEGMVSEGPYDAILINGAVQDMPAGLLDQLKDGGRMTAIRQDGPVARFAEWQRSGEAYALSESAIATANVLPGFAKAPEFVF